MKFCKQLIVTAAGCSRFFAPWYFPLFQLFVRSQNAASATESVPLFFFFFEEKKTDLIYFFFFCLECSVKAHFHSPSHEINYKEGRFNRI